MSALSRNKWVGAAAAIAIAVGATAIVYSIRSGPEKGSWDAARVVRKPRPVTLFCPKCELAFSGKVTGPADLPVLCPRCNERTGRIAWWCSNCRLVFEEDPARTREGDFAAVRCPKCGELAEGVDSLLADGSLSPSDVPGLAAPPSP